MTITSEEARALLQREQQKRLAACRAELREVLNRHNCQLVVQLGITSDGRVVGSSMIAERPPGGIEDAGL